MGKGVLVPLKFLVETLFFMPRLNAGDIPIDWIPYFEWEMIDSGMAEARWQHSLGRNKVD